MMKTQRAKKMQYLYSCILMVFLLTLSSPSWAQKRTISGIVTDETNEPVIGANVVIKNTTVGTITGIDGQYRIEAPDNATLVFSFIGYNSIEEKVNRRTQINVSMKSNDITLSDVVVVGYGVQKKVSLTGAIAGVRSTDLLKTKNENPQNMLTGKISGVRVWQKSAEPGSYSNNFDIRGYDAPLVIIDGVPRDVQDKQARYSRQRRTRLRAKSRPTYRAYSQSAMHRTDTSTDNGSHKPDRIYPPEICISLSIARP